MRFLFKPSANSQPGVFLIPSDVMQKLGEAQAQFEAANDPEVMAEALDMVIKIVVKLYNETTPADMPRGIIVPRWIRYRWYKRGMRRVLEALCADDQVE